MIVLFAQTHARAMYYARNYGLEPSQYRIVTSREQIMGLDNFTFIRIGDWYRHPEVNEIMEYVRSRRDVKLMEAD